MMKTRPRRPIPRVAIDFRRLCLVARGQFLADRTVDDPEWKDRIKDRVVALGFLCPLSAQVYPAMAGVTAVFRKQPAAASRRRARALRAAAWRRSGEERANYPRQPSTVTAPSAFTSLKDILEPMLQPSTSGPSSQP